MVAGQLESKFYKIMKIWKKIEKINYKNTNELLKAYKEKNIKLSPWIEDIFKKENYSFDNIILPLSLVRISLKDLGFTGPTELDKVYEKSKLENLSLVEPSIALLCREFYLEQSTGEWLRFATPFESMIDSDGVPHLPKLGKALNLYFVETYWSYPKAIFHPHNEFVFKI